MSATGIGSWPGTDVAEALAVVRGELTELPFLPELPSRGPGADLIGRAAARLVSLPIDLQPGGWRLVDRPGRDQARAEAFWREDLDRMASAFDGYAGLLKVQLAGPWTLASTVWLPRGERAVVDRGATRDLLESMAQTVRELVADVVRLVPGAEPVVQLDEPALPAVLEGRVPTASGFGRLRAVPALEVQQGLASVLAAAVEAGGSTAVHCCAPDVPIGLLRDAGAQAIAVDVTLLGPAGWESVAASVEAGVALWAGVVPTLGELPGAATLSARVARWWSDVGLPVRDLEQVVVTPTCGLAGASPHGARAALTRARETARELAERAQG
ncbi:methionine synthase [Angustibacter sp. McL0619]|uniref:methionine synthase n=1 Tax=Angustibacter sp. McL0619 TaxID=3415676 RepID=UPI003CF1CBBF